MLGFEFFYQFFLPSFSFSSSYQVLASCPALSGSGSGSDSASSREEPNCIYLHPGILPNISMFFSSFKFHLSEMLWRYFFFFKWIHPSPRGVGPRPMRGSPPNNRLNSPVTVPVCEDSVGSPNLVLPHRSRLPTGHSMCKSNVKTQMHSKASFRGNWTSMLLKFCCGTIPHFPTALNQSASKLSDFVIYSYYIIIFISCICCHFCTIMHETVCFSTPLL